MTISKIWPPPWNGNWDFIPNQVVFDPYKIYTGTSFGKVDTDWVITPLYTDNTFPEFCAIYPFLSIVSEDYYDFKLDSITLWKKGVLEVSGEILQS